MLISLRELKKSFLRKVAAQRNERHASIKLASGKSERLSEINGRGRTDRQRLIDGPFVLNGVVENDFAGAGSANGCESRLTGKQTSQSAAV